MKEEGRGFAGLSDLVSDLSGRTRPSPAEPAPVAAAPLVATAGGRKVFPPVELTKRVTLPAPWSSADSGETWVWGDFFMTFQTKPKLVMELIQERLGKRPPPHPVCHLYAMSVFYRQSANPHAPSQKPILIVTLEQADLNAVAQDLGSTPASEMPLTGTSLELRVYSSGDMWVSLSGAAEAIQARDTARDCFLNIVGHQLGLTGRPDVIGTMADARGHPATGLPEVTATRHARAVPDRTITAGPGDPATGTSDSTFSSGRLGCFACLAAVGLLLFVAGTVRQDGPSGMRRPPGATVPAPRAPAPSRRPNYPALPLPFNGEIQTHTSRQCVAPLEVRASPGSHYLIKLVSADTGETALTVFVRKGMVASVKAPLGDYELRYAAGETWYGYEHFFGPDTGYSKAESLLSFRDTGSEVSGYTVSLFKVAHGNLHTSQMPARDF